MKSYTQLQLFTATANELTDADIKQLARRSKISLAGVRTVARAAEDAAALLAEGDCTNDDGTTFNCSPVAVLALDKSMQAPAYSQVAILTERDWPTNEQEILFWGHRATSAKEICTVAIERLTNLLRQQVAMA